MYVAMGWEAYKRSVRERQETERQSALDRLSKRFAALKRAAGR